MLKNTKLDTKYVPLAHKQRIYRIFLNWHLSLQEFKMFHVVNKELGQMPITK